MNNSRHLRMGLALGGGGARGLSHLGVLRLLLDEGIRPSVISGTSMGAVVAVGFAQERDYRHVEKKFREFVLHFASRFDAMHYIEAEKKKQRGLISETIHALAVKSKMLAFANRTYLEDERLVQEIVEHFIHPCNLQELSLPVLISALDVRTGSGVFLRTGNARKAVQASMSIAGYFPGVALNGMDLYDAQNIFPVPIQAFPEVPGVDFIVASSAGTTICDEFHPCNVVDLLFRQSDIAYQHIISEVCNCSDIVIQPNLEDIHWTSFSRMDEIVDRGYEAARAALPRIHEILSGGLFPEPLSRRAWHNAGFRGQKRFVLSGFPDI